MRPWQDLADAIIDEDRRLRGLLGQCPRHLREAGAGTGLKATLGHIRCWDDFALGQLAARVDPPSRAPARPRDVEALDRDAAARADGRPFGDVLASYLEVTGALVAFIAAHWERLTTRDREGLWISLQHRRHHRLELERLIAGG